jgi:CBS domain-containing protein
MEAGKCLNTKGVIKMKTCGDVMTRDPICCLPGDTVDKVAQIMKRKNVGSVPVVANYSSNKLIGIVTDRDLALRIVAEGRDNRHTKVESVATPDPHICRTNDPLSEAVRLMADQQVRRIVIVDDNGCVEGIIAQADIATRTEDSRQTAEVVEQISQPVPASTLHPLS